MITRLPINILLVEDNPGDVRLVQEALAEQDTGTQLSVARDGVEALDYLKTSSQATDYPAFILLDLNLPRKNGHEVLSEIKANPDLKQIPVIVLTSSKAEEDIDKAYSSSANCYVVKPLDLDLFLETVRRIISYWRDLASLPSSLGSSQNSVSY